MRAVSYTHLDKATARFAQAGRVVDEDDRVFGQIVKRGRALGVEEGQVFIRRWERTGLAQTFDVAPQVFFQVRKMCIRDRYSST